MGELAGLCTSFFWALSSIFFTRAGKQIGSVNVNRIRLVFAVILVMGAHLVTEGTFLPLSASPSRWLWLGLSGLVGLALGDTFTFQAYVMIGNRLGTLVMALSPVIGVLIGWILMGEHLALVEVAGVLLSVGGVALVVLKSRSGNGAPHDRRHYAIGILCALGGAGCQAGGLALAKQGLGGDFPAISGLVIRMIVSLVAIWAVALVMGQMKSTWLAAKCNPAAIRSVASGAFVGPFLGVWFSLMAVQLTYVGIASTLTSLAPVFLLPISRWVFKEEVSRWAVAGTVIAMSGVAVIFLVH
jgi:drug/metabolite transporter (DMT)-like permease